MDLSATGGDAPPADMSPPRRLCLRAPAASTGLTAPAGSTGLTAPAGSTGLTAPAGSTGLAAPAGSTGLTAPAGSTGSSGRPRSPHGAGAAPGGFLDGDGGGAGRCVRLLEPTPPAAGAAPDGPDEAPATTRPLLRLRLRPQPEGPAERPVKTAAEAQTAAPATREETAPDGVAEEALMRVGKRMRSSTEWGEGMSPTPTPQGMYSCDGTPSARRHSKTGILLPTGPKPIEYTLEEFVEAKYETGAKISEGTYGEVYIGRCRATGESVALKRLKVLRGLDGFPITSLREVIALRHIASARKRSDDPGETDLIEEVVTLRDVMLSKSRNDIYLVFPYISCSTAGLLQRRFPFSEREIAYIFKKLVTAVKKLHEMGIIHRDVKADNLLIDRDGFVKLGDFGLCVFKGSGRCALTPSLINLSYRPPEMLLGITAYDEKVDIWSIGCFLAQMYLRVPPFSLAQRQGNNNNADPRHHRRAETELEQLSLITQVLGPLSSAGAGAFPPEQCDHAAHLEQLRNAMSSSASWSSFTPSMSSLFQKSLLFSEFGGFASWFVATAVHRRRDPSHPIPSKDCVDVLAAIFQLDPRRRPTAAQLLEMPFFDLHRPDPRRTARGGDGAAMSEDEAVETQIRQKLAEKLSRYQDSHISPVVEGKK